MATYIDDFTINMQLSQFPKRHGKEAERVLAAGRYPCLLMNPNLTPMQTRNFIKEYYVFAIVIDGVDCMAVAFQLSKRRAPPYRVEDMMSKPQFAEWEKADFIAPMEDMFIENPFSLLLRENLKPYQLKTYEIYELIDLNIDGKPRKAIKCAWRYPDENIKGRVLKQQTILGV